MQDIGLVAGVGGGIRNYWIFNELGTTLTACGILNNISVTFNLSSEEDINTKISELRTMRDNGLCSDIELAELEERVRTSSNFVLGGRSTGTSVALGESFSSCIGEGRKYKKGEVTTTYRDGKLVKIKHRGSRKGTTSPNVIRACEIARKYAHTSQADAKRRKSINARKETKMLEEQ